MEEPREHTTPEEVNETLVTPRFDEEETVLAQPVVPLDAAGAEETPTPEPAYAARPSAPPARAPRSQWPLALILVSALVGSVIGGTGLYFFQKHRSADAATQQPAAPPAEETRPAPAPTVEQAAEANVESAPVAVPVEAAEPPAEEDETPAAEPVRDNRDDDDAPRAERPAARDEGSREDSPRRGKKGERDTEVQRRERNNSDDGPPATGRPAPRRVDSIVYPSRREERRAQRQAERRARRAERQADRLRAIFEGEPE
jgi:hypothetical protein